VRFPWTRVKEERAKRLEDERKLRETQADWKHVNHVRRELRAAYGPNGWTGIANKLFSGEARR
jgi:hypothetical protein